MSEPLTPASETSASTIAEPSSAPDPASNLDSNPEPKPSYVKLAMRNMVRKGSKSLFHFGLTTAGLLGILVGLAYLTR
jgi:hypothetical protein